MLRFAIESNKFLSQKINAFYHTDYVGYKKKGNPDYINTLKNTYNSLSAQRLNIAVQELSSVLMEDLGQIIQIGKINSLLVCVVPRAKAESTYCQNQLLFKSTVKNVVDQLFGLVDGTNCIIRHTNTKTTHLPPSTPNYNNDGAAPFPGITANTCNILNNVMDRDILLVDDIYTRFVNIDEDAIQALLNMGAQSVIFYAVGRTVYNKF
jgi:predicted amidophosphoribosyltransferase